MPPAPNAGQSDRGRPGGRVYRVRPPQGRPRSDLSTDKSDKIKRFARNRNGLKVDVPHESAERPLVSYEPAPEPDPERGGDASLQCGWQSASAPRSAFVEPASDSTPCPAPSTLTFTSLSRPPRRSARSLSASATT